MTISIPKLRLLMLIVTLVLAPLSSPLLGTYAQDDVSLPIEILVDHGVEISMLAAGTVELDSSSATHLTLERVTLQADTVFGPYAPPSPALMIVEQGSFLSEDDRGFRTIMKAPFQMVQPPSPPVTWKVSEPTTFLRLGLTDGNSSADHTSGIEVETLANLTVEDVPRGATRLFIATAELSDETGSIRIDHDGPVGVHIQRGSLEMVSPSGMEGSLDIGQSALYVSNTPVEILSTNDTGATSLIFGLADSATSDQFLQATVVDACRNLPYDCTLPGSSLENGETWFTPTASLQLRGSTERNMWNGEESLILEITYTNRQDESVQFTADSEEMTVSYDYGVRWENPEDDHTFVLNAGESETITWEFIAPSGEGDTLIDVGEFGDISDAQWYGEVIFAFSTDVHYATSPDLHRSA